MLPKFHLIRTYMNIHCCHFLPVHASLFRNNYIHLTADNFPPPPASYPDVSLDMRAKEGGKETTGESVPFPWSLAVYHQSLVSRSPLPCEKRSTWGGGCPSPMAKTDSPAPDIVGFCLLMWNITTTIHSK